MQILIIRKLRGGHFEFSPLVKLARIFTRFAPAHFNQHPQIDLNQPSNLGPGQVVTGPYCGNSTNKTMNSFK